MTEKKYYPLSSTQEQFYFLCEKSLSTPLYNLSFIVHLKGDIKIDLLQETVHLLIERHSMFRTSFILIKGKPYQVIQKKCRIKIPIVPIEKNTIEEEFNKPFDLTKAPLLRFKLVNVSFNQSILLMTFHHIITDKWSMRIFINEFSIIYNSLVENKKITLPPLSYQYIDFVLREKYDESEITFWKNYLKDVPTLLEITKDKIRPNTTSFKGRYVTFQLEPKQVIELKKIVQKNNSSIFKVLLFIFQLFLYKYTDQKDFAIGIPVATRSDNHFHDVIGLFINTLAIRTQINPTELITDFFKRSEHNLIEALTHRNTPFEKVIEHLNIPRFSNITPLFQVIFLFQDFNKLQFHLDHVDSLLTMYHFKNATKFDLILEWTEFDESILGKFEFSENVFNQETIERMKDYFIHLLNEILFQEDKPLVELSLLSDAQKKQILIEWNDTEKIRSNNLSIQHLVEINAEKNPNALAIIDATSQITYSLLNNKSNQLANYLLSIPIPPKSYIGIFLNKSIELAISMLAILKMGCVCVSLDTTYPTERLIYILEDLNDPFILTIKKLSNHSFLKKSKMIFVDEESIFQKPISPVKTKIDPTDLAYVIYTSGTTGNPKGVLLSHQGIIERINWLCETVNYSPKDKLLHTFSFNFDAAIISLWWPLSSGFSVVFTKDNDIHTFSHSIISQKITMIISIPSLLNEILKLLIHQPPTSLTYIFSGGELFSISLLTMIKKLGNSKVYNLYGPTECSIFSTYFDATHYNPCQDEIALPIGKPISNSKVYILDPDLRPVAIGISGEIYLGGTGIAKGYLHQPDLAKLKFIKNPYQKNELLYKTGDSGKFRSDGNIDFIGRVDFQIKIHGFRIEPEEIETILLQNTFINEAAVVLYHQTTLICYLKMKNQKEIDENAFRNYLLQKIPAYMIPTKFIVLDELPHLPNGKIDRVNLARKEIPLKKSSSHQGEVEKKLIAIWKNVLNIKKINLESNFFLLGGNSLLSFSLVEAINKTFKTHLNSEFIFDYQTIESQANQINQPEQFHEKKSIVSLNNVKDKPILYCLHPVGGNTTCYLKLASLMSQFSIHGIRANSSMVFNSLEELASFYLSEIKSKQPQGPYSLIGWSTGGLLAFEIAKQLKETGNDISLLMLLDTSNPLFFPPVTEMKDKDFVLYLLEMIFHDNNTQKTLLFSKTYLLKTFFKIFGFNLLTNKLFLSSLGIKKISFKKEKVIEDIQKMKIDLSSRDITQFPIHDWFSFLIDNRMVKENIDINYIATRYEMFRYHFYLCARYVPTFYNDKIIFLTIMKKPVANKWKNYGSSIKKITVPGNHFNLLKKTSTLQIIKDIILRRNKP